MDQSIYRPDRDDTESADVAEVGPAVDRWIHARVALQGYAKAARGIAARDLDSPHVLGKEATTLIVDLAHLLYLGGGKPQEALLTASKAFAAETGTGAHLTIGIGEARTAPRLPGPGVEFDVDEHLTHTVFVSEAELNDEAPGWESFVDGGKSSEEVADALSSVIAERVSDRTVTGCEEREITDQRRQ